MNAVTNENGQHLKSCADWEHDTDPVPTAYARRLANRDQREAIAKHVAELTRLLESYAQVRDEARMAWALDEIQKQVATYRSLL